MADAFLRIPPFPGNRATPLAVSGEVDADASASELAQLLREKKVGGNFWGSRTDLPQGRDILLAATSRLQAQALLDAAAEEGLLDRCVMIEVGGLRSINWAVPQLSDALDQWYIAEAATEIWASADHELALVAALSHQRVRLFGEGRFNDVSVADGLLRAVGQEVASRNYRCPFSGEPITPWKAIGLLASWRDLIARNRDISAVFGVASWKRPTVNPMLWDGTSSSPRYARSISTAWNSGTRVFAWHSRTPPEILNRLAAADVAVAEIEDGMIRGRGLGANCVPPLSVVIDFSGIYFDPSQPSDLENILNFVDIDDAMLARAVRLRRAIVDARISKYGGGADPVVKQAKGRRVLVVGQVEDDRSVTSGGHGQTNLGLLERARAIEPEAWLIYRPHPDVEAGHRKGHIHDEQLLGLADEVERGGSISDLIDAVDELHCITSLAGFEALIRGKKVTTHGVPFYAGWGLTTDLGPVPPRRGRQRSIDELVAATLILYPTYVDPVTGLPCPPEVLIERIAQGEDEIKAPLAGLRILQGKLRVAFRRLREAAV